MPRNKEDSNEVRQPKKLKMTEQDKKDWDDLYQYVKTDVLGYDANQALPKWSTMQLKGFREGKYCVNNSVQATAMYPFTVVLATFKVCKSDIEWAIKTKNFENENHKLRYILKIVESHINDVYIMMKHAEEQRAKSEIAATTSNVVVEGEEDDAAESFKSYAERNSPRKDHHEFDDMW